jgi:hypothetical protein
MIQRLLTQRACLEFAARELGEEPGPLLELGLGKGRSYDFLRRRLPWRELYAFDREVHAPIDCIPDPGHLILGDFRSTLPAFAERHGRIAALVHADVGSEQRQHDRQLAAALGPLIHAVARPGALVLCDRPLLGPDWSPLPLPAEAGDWDYFLYRVGR